jgi:hypothetical protein
MIKLVGHYLDAMLILGIVLYLAGFVSDLFGYSMSDAVNWLSLIVIAGAVGRAIYHIIHGGYKVIKGR